MKRIRNDKVASAKLAMENTELTTEQKNQLEKQTVRLTRQHVDDIKQLLDYMGVSYVQANGEAEAYASEMCRQGNGRLCSYRRYGHLDLWLS